MSTAKPNLEQLKKQAKELVRGHGVGDASALAIIRAHHPKLAGASDDAISAAPFQLSDAQWAIARSLGAPSWPALVHQLSELPLLPVRGLVVFPGQRRVLQVGRPKSLAALRAATADDGLIVMVTQRVASTDEPAIGDLHAIGVLGRIEEGDARAPGEKVAKVDGLRRVKIVRVAERDGMLVAETEAIDDAEATEADTARRDDALVKLQQAMLEADDPASLLAAIASR